MFNPSDWLYMCIWNEDDGLIEWYEHVLTGECVDREEYEKLRTEK